MPKPQALRDALNILEGGALYRAAEHSLWTRMAECDGFLYLDLANDVWEAVEITPTGWRVIAEPPVKFHRPGGMVALPRPVDEASIDELRRFVNVEKDEEWAPILGWLAAALSPQGPLPVLILYCEQGSAKSTVSHALRALVDPNRAPLLAEPRDMRDLMITVHNNWCLAFDNLSHLPLWLSDALCRLSTGGGFATRRLYMSQTPTKGK